MKETKKVAAVMSVPRLGFMDNMYTAYRALAPLQIPLTKTTGVFWGKCLEKAMTDTIELYNPEWLLTLDYDTVFFKENIEELLLLTDKYPDVDAFVPIQYSRHKHTVMIDMETCQTKPLDTESLKNDEITMINSGHFGLTLIRASAFKDLGKWALAQKIEPHPENAEAMIRYSEDIAFWIRWREKGYKVASANRISIGHMELMIIWPDKELRPVVQTPQNFYEVGKPEDVF